METTVKEMVSELMGQHDLDASAIAKHLDDRVTTRTVYRWAKGECEPQKQRDLEELKVLYKDTVKGS